MDTQARGKNGMPARTPRLNLLVDYVHWYSEHQPDAEAVVSGPRRLSYRQLATEVDICSRALIAAGVLPGDRIATLSAPNTDFLILFLATSSIGAIWLGLNPRYQARELSHALQDSQPRMLFCCERVGSRNFVNEIEELAGQCETLETVIYFPTNALTNNTESYQHFHNGHKKVSVETLAQRRSKVHSKSTALIVYTSGSTGQPKGAMISHHALITCSLTQLGIWHATILRMVNFLPINHIGCVGDISCYLLVGGGTNIFMEQFDPRASLKLMQDEQVTVWGGVPTSFQMCLDLEDFDAFDLSSLQIIFWSGAAASLDLVTRLSKLTPRLATSYGMTETVGSVTFTEVSNNVSVLAETIGKAPANYEVRLMGTDGNPAICGEQGEIQVRGDFIMSGYWNRPSDTAAVIDSDGWLSSGDLAVQLDDGNLKLVGRMKEMFKSGGYNVYPREIEQQIESHPDVTTAAVIAIPDDLFQEVGWAFVGLAPGASLSDHDLRTYCREHLANFKIPKKIFFMDPLPMLPIGKVDKQALRRWAADH